VIFPEAFGIRFVRARIFIRSTSPGAMTHPDIRGSGAGTFLARTIGRRTKFRRRALTLVNYDNCIDFGDACYKSYGHKMTKQTPRDRTQE
jgi:hypothetical protein